MRGVTYAGAAAVAAYFILNASFVTLLILGAAVAAVLSLLVAVAIWSQNHCHW